MFREYKGVEMIVNEHLRAVKRPNGLPNALNIGLTGGMGSGKSTVARLLQESGALLLDLDAIAHGLTAAGGAAMPEIERVFGRKVVTEEGALNRAAMRELVFNDPNQKTQLERIIHPLIFSQAIEQANAKVSDSTERPLCVLYDIPLLARSAEWQALLDWIVVVDCPVEIRIARIQQRNPQLKYEQIQKIIATQASADEMRAIADVVLDNAENDSEHLQLKAQVNILVKQIQRFSLPHTTIEISSP